MKTFRLLIAGGRDFAGEKLFRQQMYYFLREANVSLDDIEIVSGGCRFGTPTFTREDGTIICGADGLAEKFAKERYISLKTFDADWNKYGKKAGYIRNKEMAEYITNAILFWDGKSKGTKMMIELATKYCKAGTVVHYDKEPNEFLQ